MQEQRFGMLGCNDSPVVRVLHKPGWSRLRPERHRAAPDRLNRPARDDDG